MIAVVQVLCLLHSSPGHHHIVQDLLCIRHSVSAYYLANILWNGYLEFCAAAKENMGNSFCGKKNFKFIQLNLITLHTYLTCILRTVRQSDRHQNISLCNFFSLFFSVLDFFSSFLDKKDTQN